jgi:hypothetical protein
MSEIKNGSDVESIIRAIEDHLQPSEMDITESSVAVVQAGQKVVDLLPFAEARLTHPRRRVGTSVHTTLASFMEHVERQRDEASAIFACDDYTKPSFDAVYDYHEPSKLVTYPLDPSDATKTVRSEREGHARFMQHRAHYSMPFSEEWIAWQRIAGPDAVWLDQLQFAQALEDRGLDVVPIDRIPANTLAEATALGITPGTPSQISTMSRGLIVRADRKVGQSVNLATGEGRITFEETHETKVGDAPVVVPSGFVIGVPVFRDDAAYSAIVRLRYRQQDARIKWKLTMHRVEGVFRDAFRKVAQSVEKKTALPLFFGTPESTK